MAAIFGPHDVARSGGSHRRSGSAHSNRSIHSSYSNRPHSPSPFSRRPRDSFSHQHRASQGALLSSSPRLRAQHMDGLHSEEAVDLDLEEAGGRPQSVSEYAQMYGSDFRPEDENRNAKSHGAAAVEPSPVISTMSTTRTRSVSRSSRESANTMQSIIEEAAPVDTANPAHLYGPNGPSPPINNQLRIGRTSWYRSLHGISPLSRQPKSLSSSDNEFVFGVPGAPTPDANGAADMARSGSNSGKTAIRGNALPASRIPRIAGQPVRRQLAQDTVSPEPQTGIGGLASRLKRKVLSPINMHRERQRNSSLSREMQRAQAAVDRYKSGIEPDKNEATASNDRLSEELESFADDPLPRPSSSASVNSVQRPDMPPPSRIPPPRTQRQPQPPSEQKQQQQQEQQKSTNGWDKYKSVGDIAAIPEAVKNALLRRIRSPLSGRPDRSSSRLSVRDRISAFNTLSMNSRGNSKGQVSPPQHQQQQQQQHELGTPPVSGSEHSAARRAAAAETAAPSSGRSVMGIPPTPPMIAQSSASYGRSRIGTPTGFISMVSPVSGVPRSNSRASSIVSMNTRPVSPALSQRSNVSMRIQDAIYSLERATGSAIATTPRAQNMPTGASSGLSGTKRAAASVSEALDRTTPTKRPRAPSAVSYVRPDADAAHAKSTSLNPLDMVQRMVRRHTGR
ncbi:hypothetical protein GGI22_002859 [Coemansia erecta]|nr:hypothetical protein GGI22_002859 [Coemansia erecta]